MIFMTKDGAQLYSFDNAAMELSDADKRKIRGNIENVKAPATSATIDSFLGELDGIIELFTPQLVAEPFIYLLKQEALRIKATIRTELDTLRAMLITDDILITKKFLLNMNFIDYAYSLYESGFTQKISDYALGASRISAAVSAYRDRKLATTPSETLLGNIIALLKVYIPPVGAPTVNEQVGLWLTLLDFANDSNPRLQIIESIIADLVKNAIDVVPGSNPPQGNPATILDAFQKFSAITLSKSTGGIPCIPFSYFEAGFEKVDCGNPSVGRINPFAQFGRYAGLMDGAVKLKAPKFICKKDSSIAITRKFKVVYEKYIADAYNRIRGYSAALPPQAGGAYIQKGGARNLVNKEWSGKTRYDRDSYGITEKFMYYKREQQSIQFVSRVTGAYRRPEEINAIKKMQSIIGAKYAAILRTRSEYEDLFNTYRNRLLNTPGDFAGNVIQFFEENPDNEYIAAEKMLIVASIDTRDTKVVARNNYITAIDSLFAPDADALAHGRRANAAAQALFASDTDDAEGANTIDEYVNQLSEIASLLNREEYIAAEVAAAVESPAQASAGDFRYLEFLLYKYLKVYHDLYRGTSIDGEYDLFLQELSVLRSKCYMGIFTPGYVWDRLVTLILDETIANPYSCVSHFLLNYTGLKEDMKTIINLLYKNCSVGLRRFIESVYNYYTDINLEARFSGWGLEKYTTTGPAFVATEAIRGMVRETDSARERRIRAERRNRAVSAAEPPEEDYMERILRESARDEEGAGVTERKESEEEEVEEEEGEELALEEVPAMIIRATTPIPDYLAEENEEDEAEERRREARRPQVVRRGGVRHKLKQLGKKSGTRKAGASSKGRRTRRRK
jgi:DNA-directed RNA polymerase delta subunit